MKDEEKAAALRSREEHHVPKEEQEQRPWEGKSVARPRDARRPVRLRSRDPRGEKRNMRVREAGRGQPTPGPTEHSTDFKSYSMCGGNTI